MSKAVTANTTIFDKGSSTRANVLSNRAQFIVNIFFILYSLACIIPLILIFSVAFSNETDIIRNGYKMWPQTFDTYAFEFLFIDWQAIIRAYAVQIFVTVFGTMLSVLIMALYAYPISRPDFPHRNFFSFFAFFTILFNGGLIPWYLVYVNFLGLRDSYWALIMPFLVSAFWVLVMRTFFQNSIPLAVLESAKIDGAGELRIFARIVFPLSMPVLASVALFQTLLYWNDFFLALVFIRSDEKFTVQYLMYKALLNVQFLAQNPTIAAEITRSGGTVKLPNETVRMAMAVVGIGPIVFAYPFFQRYFVKGLTVGAVKG